MSGASEPRRAPEWLIDLVLLGALFTIAIAIYLALGDRTALDCDVANLALGIERFDPRQHQPHPPGYLGYVLLLRALHATFGLTLLETAKLASRLFALATIPLAWAAGRALAPDDRSVARLTALLTATNPILLYYGVDGQTHSAEAAMAAALLWALCSPRLRSSRASGLVFGILLAIGGSLRPSFALVSVAPVLWVLWPDWKQLALTGLVGAAGTLAWLVPSAILSGGWRVYRLADRTLIGYFVRITSALSAEHDPRQLALNLRDVSWWALIALLAPVLAFAAHRLTRGRATPAARRAGALFGFTVIPAMAFYVLVLCAEAGYLAGLVPVAALSCATLATRGSGAALPARLLAPLLCLAQLAFFFAAPAPVGRTFMTPDASEVVARELRAKILYHALEDGLRPGTRLLVLTDFPDPTLLRQLPLLEPEVAVLFRIIPMTERDQHGERKRAISYATRHGWLPAPGPVLGADGDRPGITTTDRFDVIAIDPRASNQFRALLARQTACPIAPKREDFIAQRLPASCFPSGRIAIGDYWLRFGAP